MSRVKDNGEQLRELVESTTFTQVEALALMNQGQARPTSLSTWKAYLADRSSARRRNPPDSVLAHARKILEKHAKNS